MTQFSNKQIFTSELPDWQEIQFEKISPKYTFVVFGRYILLLLSFLFLLFGFFWIKGVSWNQNYQYGLIGGLLFLLLLLALNIWSMRYWGYALREHDISYRSGIFIKTVKIIPFKQVQHVDIKESALSRIFGLSSLELHTAGAGEGLKIPGIKRSQVSFIQEYISQKISPTVTN